jgi:hypothetical protein
MFSTAVGYKLIASDLTAALERTASQPNVERDSAYYLANITSIKSTTSSATTASSSMR